MKTSGMFSKDTMEYMRKESKAKEIIEYKYCQRCKKRLLKVVDEGCCMKIFWKENRLHKMSAIRCKAFKRINNET